MSNLIHGLEIVDLSPFRDLRGSFTRIFQQDFFRDDFRIRNVNLSHNPRKGTLRGFHYSVGPDAEDKIFHCMSGSIFNATVDVRPGSKTFGQVEINTLDSSEPRALLVPGGCANAWMTLEANTSVLYLVSADYDPQYERGMRFDDESFNIAWPSRPEVISEKDLSWRPFR